MVGEHTWAVPQPTTDMIRTPHLLQAKNRRKQMCQPVIVEFQHWVGILRSRGLTYYRYPCLTALPPLFAMPITLAKNRNIRSSITLGVLVK